MYTIPTESFVLGRVIGIFLVICGLTALIKRKDWMEVVGQIRNNPPLTYFVALAELAVGLIIAFYHPVWIMDWPVVITAIGWSMVVESACYLVIIPGKTIGRLIEFFNRPLSYYLCGILSLLIGSYLIVMAFELI